MEKRSYNSDDLAAMPLDKPLTGNDLMRILRAGIERDTSIEVRMMLSALLQVLLEDAGFGAAQRKELERELPLMTPSELLLLRKALQERRSPSEPEEPADEVPPVLRER